MAVEAEDAGFDAVMVSEHVVLGPGAGRRRADGEPARLRAARQPGPGDAVAELDRAPLGDRGGDDTPARSPPRAIIAPLRHPLLLARELGTLDLLSEGRLVVQPTVSWHRARVRGARRAVRAAAARCSTSTSRRGRSSGATRRRPSTASHYRFDDVYFEPKAVAPRRAAPLARRRAAARRACCGASSGTATASIRSGSRPTRTSRRLRDGAGGGGRDLGELELVGGMRGRLPRRREPVADLDDGARVDPGAGRAGLHVDLHQAVAVPRRPSRSTPRGAARSSRGSQP